jgi:putative spermidine/putrescine transport system permease protein
MPAWPAARNRSSVRKAAMAPYATPVEIAWQWFFRLICTLVFLFLLIPILAIIPLSFNSSTFLTYPLQGFSMRWYSDVLGTERWLLPIKNSLIVSLSTTVLATILGTMAALGLSRLKSRARSLAMGLILSPLIIPVIITAVGMYFLFAPLGLTNGYLGLILSHTAIAVPFVVITVAATLQGFDANLMRAAANLGASPLTAFRRVMLPLILPGVVSGALFAFAASFDEIVISLFLAGPQQRTLPLQMLSGVREEISPSITAVATLLVIFSAVLLASVELLRRRSEKLIANDAT